MNGRDIFLSLDYYEKSCKKDQMRACYRLGLLYDNECKSGFKANSTKAVKLFDKACKGGYPKACAQYGHMLKYGIGVEKNITKAIGLFREYCDEKYSSLLACVELGYVYKNGIDNQGYTIEKNSAEAGRRFARACNQGELAGCVGLAFLHRDGEEGLNQNYLKSFELFKESCQQGYSRGCSGMGYAYEKSLGVEKNITLAYKYYKRGCDGCDMWGCNNQAALLEYGRGIEKNETKARKLYKRACENGYYLGCVNLGRIYRDGKGGLKKDYKEAIRLYELAQEHDEPRAYTFLGIMYEKGHGVEKNLTKAYSLYKQGCKKGDMCGCRNQGTMIKLGKMGERNETQAKEFYEKACEGKLYCSCVNLGNMYQHGKGVPERDYKEAIRLYELAKEHDTPSAYTSLGYMYEKELGVDRNLTKAYDLYKQGCEKGNMRGCNNQAILMEDEKAGEKLMLFSKSCSGGFEGACLNIYIGTKSISKDIINNIIIDLKKACKKNNRASCYALGNIYNDEKFQGKNGTLAFDYYKKACNNKYDRYCGGLGLCYLDGIGTNINNDKWIEIYKKMCENNISGACSSLGNSYEVEKKYQEALYYDEKSCELGMAYDCLGAGMIIKDGKGKVTKNIKKAIGLAEKAIHKGLHNYKDDLVKFYLSIDRKKYRDKVSQFTMETKSDCDESSVACEELANIYSYKKNPFYDKKKEIVYRKKECTLSDASDAYEIGFDLKNGKNGVSKNIDAALYCLDQSCKKGEVAGCIECGNIYYDGKETKRDHKISLKYFKLGCELEDAYSCYSLGYLYYNDHTITHDDEKAKTFLRKGCKLGSDDACEILKDEYNEQMIISVTPIKHQPN